MIGTGLEIETTFEDPHHSELVHESVLSASALTLLERQSLRPTPDQPNQSALAQNTQVGPRHTTESPGVQKAVVL